MFLTTKTVDRLLTLTSIYRGFLPVIDDERMTRSVSRVQNQEFIYRHLFIVYTSIYETLNILKRPIYRISYQNNNTYCNTIIVHTVVAPFHLFIHRSQIN